MSKMNARGGGKVLVESKHLIHPILEIKMSACTLQKLLFPQKQPFFLPLLLLNDKRCIGKNLRQKQQKNECFVKHKTHLLLSCKELYKTHLHLFQLFFFFF